MAATGARGRAVVCDDRPVLRNAVTRLLTASGIDVVAVADSFRDVPELVLTAAADLVVVSLPLTGMTGLRAVRALRDAAPDCDIIVLAASGALELAALEAGARALVPEDDLRGLQAVLRELPARRPEGQPAVASGSESTTPSS